MKEKITEDLFIAFQKLPRGMKYRFSKLIFKPVLEKEVRIYGYVVFGPGVRIGFGSYIHDGSNLSRISVGKYTRIAKNFLYIPTLDKEYTHFSNYKFATIPFSRGGGLRFSAKEKNTYPIASCTIGSDVWIGENVTILGNVTVGDGAVIGACSVVTKDVPPFSIAAGSPARFLRYRYETHKIELMKKIKWWDWPLEKIYENYERLCVFDEKLLDDEIR